MKPLLHVLAWPVLILVPGLLPAEPADFPPEQLEFFEKKIRPIFVEHCQKCHAGEKQEGSLRLDSRAAILRGGDTGPAVVPGKLDEGELIQAVLYDPDGYQMPPEGKLPQAKIDLLKEWVRMGAPWPAETADTAASGKEFDLAARAEHWSFQPLRPVDVPAVHAAGWCRSPIDNFILSKLEANQLPPANEADRRTWIRRVSLDAIGLPPSPEEVREFLADETPQAYERVVDRLLASPHFGERWGRHWLDVVRYAESRGHEFDYDVANAWQYRDYVIRAINDDVPFDRFVVEHIAGDLLVRDEGRGRGKEGAAGSTSTFPLRLSPFGNESIVATGFWFLGEWVHSPVDIRQEEADRFDNMIDVFSKAFLGLTVSCARCHDHKFDPITQRDFYALQGYLQSTSYQQTPFETQEQNKEIADRLHQLDLEFGRRLAAAVTGPATAVPHVASVSLLPESDVETRFTAEDLIPGGPGFQLIGWPELALRADGENVRFVDTPGTSIVRFDPLWFTLETPADNVQEPGALKDWNRGGRILRTPTFEIQSGRMFALVKGNVNTYLAVDSHILLNGPLHGALARKHEPASDWKWIEHRVNGYQGHRAHLELIPQPGAEFVVAAVVQSKGDAVTTEFRSRTAGAAAELLAPDSMFAEIAPMLNQLRREYEQKRSELVSQLRTASRTAPAMLDGSPEDEYVFIRGNWKKRGETVPRRFLEVFQGTWDVGRGTRDGEIPTTLSGERGQTSSGSGRLNLAMQMIDPDQTPILPRVIVNRIWKHYFGRGIVPTPNDFGHLGLPPTHPELLDWLAGELVRRDWSLKSVHREILLSSAYRMSSDLEGERGGVSPPFPAETPMASSEGLRPPLADPENQLFHRMNVKRLEGEIIRDSILAVSGRLNRRLLGPSIPIHLTAFLEGRGRPGTSGPIDGDGRRSVYLSVRRNFPEPFFQAFDFPNPHTSIGQRNVSNVPAQALAMMNNPLVVQQSRVWANQLLEDLPQAAIDDRIRHLFETAFSRSPTAAEIEIGSAFLASQADEYRAPLDDPRVWADYCHVLLNLKEFLFVR